MKQGALDELGGMGIQVVGFNDRLRLHSRGVVSDISVTVVYGRPDSALARAMRSATRTPCYAVCHAENEGVWRTLMVGRMQ
jgi:hypothetical protein